MKLEKALSDIKEIAGAIYSKGWGEASAGNMSVLVDDDLFCKCSNEYELPDRFESICGKTIVITSSGSRMRQIAAGEAGEFCSIVRISDTGTSYTRQINQDLVPSSELIAHLLLHNEFLNKKKNIRAVVHCHPDEIITLLNMHEFRTEEEINAMLFSIHTETELLIPEGVGLTGLKKTGSYELASSVLSCFKKHKIALMEKHGCISAGKDLNDAFDKIEFVNKAVRICLDIKKLNREQK
jgi:rhamnulose-1-phosphate aldolase